MFNSVVVNRPVLFLMVALLALGSVSAQAQQWRTEEISPITVNAMEAQRQSIDDLARRHFGRQLNGQKDNDIALMQRLLDENIVTSRDVRQLQSMGLILGQILKSQKGLSWIIYIDKYGRSKALQVRGFEKEFIFPVTQISRKAEVGIRVNVAEIYKELEQTVIDIRNKPPF
ncbi:DUF3806 domain-containing protein [Oceanicoccus sagamiensis]|nr:DUF3806 domain-containing protein [Oceanicoccus sagamiensis]